MLTERENNLKLLDFTKVYGSGKKSVYGCRNINLTAEKGIVTGLLGPNGAGKSTILKAVSGVHYATSGKVIVNGIEDPVEIRKITGFVPEYPQLDQNLTVKETLFLEAELHQADKSLRQKYIDEAVSICSLEPVYYQKVQTLSKGYRQRTSLAKALCFDSKVLVMDEFSGGLDPSQIVEMKKNILKLAENKIVLLSTHHIDEAVSLCSSIYIISQGTVKFSGSIENAVKSSGKKNLEEAFIFYTDKSNFKEDSEVK